MPEYRATAPGREITSLDFMQICTDLHRMPGGIKTRLDNFAIDVDALDKGFSLLKFFEGGDSLY